eukprot:COSAG02_NODE_4431_length_5366_cov_9.496298_6_plen_196_part_01
MACCGWTTDVVAVRSGALRHVGVVVCSGLSAPEVEGRAMALLRSFEVAHTATVVAVVVRCVDCFQTGAMVRFVWWIPAPEVMGSATVVSDRGTSVRSRAVTAAVVSCVDGLFQTGVVVHSVWFPVSEAKDSVVVASAVLDSCSWWQSFIPLVSSPSPSSLFLRNRGDWRSNEPSGLGPEYRVVAQAATVALLQALS